MPTRADRNAVESNVHDGRPSWRNAYHGSVSVARRELPDHAGGGRDHLAELVSRHPAVCPSLVLGLGRSRRRQLRLGGLPGWENQFGDGGLDPSLHPWGVANAGLGDHALHELMKGVVDGLDLNGQHTAAILLKHWLENSGTPQVVDPAQLMRDIPGFNADVGALLRQHEGDATFDSGWHDEGALNDPSNRNTPAGLDWY